jgi:hypothetical protein
MHVPAAFSRQVRNDPVGNAVQVIGLFVALQPQLPFLH